MKQKTLYLIKGVRNLLSANLPFLGRGDNLSFKYERT